MKTRGRPVLGAVAGFLFGAFVAVDLQQFAVRPLDNVSVIGIPLVGLLLGLVIGLTGPFGRGKAAAATSGFGPPVASTRTTAPVAGQAEAPTGPIAPVEPVTTVGAVRPVETPPAAPDQPDVAPPPATPAAAEAEERTDEPPPAHPGPPEAPRSEPP